MWPAPLFRTDVVCRFTPVILTLVQRNTISSMIDKNNPRRVVFLCVGFGTVWFHVRLGESSRICFRADVFSRIHRKAASLSAVTSFPIPDGSARYLALRFPRVPISKADKAQSMLLFCNLKQISFPFHQLEFADMVYTFVISFSLDLLTNVSEEGRVLGRTILLGRA